MRSPTERPRALAALTLALLACDTAADAPLDATFVGKVGGTDVVVAVALGGGEAQAYLCGGDATRSTWTRWLTGDAGSGDFSATSGGWTLTGTAQGATLTGTVSGPDGERSFHASAATGLAGLYRGAEPCPTGLVVWMTADGPAAQGAWCDGAGVYGQVEPVMPIAVTPQGVAVRLLGAGGGGDDPVWLAPVTPEVD